MGGSVVMGGSVLEMVDQQVLDNGEVGVGPVEVAELGRSEEIDGVMFGRLEGSACDGAQEGIEADPLVGIAMLYGWQRGADEDGQAEFLVDFPSEAILQGLAEALFSAWEFPFPREVHGGGTSGSEDAAMESDDGAGDFEALGGAGWLGHGVHPKRESVRPPIANRPARG